MQKQKQNKTKFTKKTTNKINIQKTKTKNKIKTS